MPSELLRKIERWYKQDLALTPKEIKDSRDRIGGSNFGELISDLRCLVVHTNVGWWRRGVPEDAISKMKSATSHEHVTTYHFQITGDGTIYISMDLAQPRRVFHASHVNGHSLGITVLNRYSDDPRNPNSGLKWSLSTTKQLKPATTEPNDLPGFKLYLTSDTRNSEVISSWWNTSNYNTNNYLGRNEVNDDNRTEDRKFYALYNEIQYRRLALTAKYILENFSLPRNVLFLPHTKQAGINNQWDSLRRILLADENGIAIMRALFNLSKDKVRPEGITTLPTDQDLHQMYLDNRKGLSASYSAGNTVPAKTKYHIKSQSIFKIFRGLHSHEFSQTNRNDPGPLFDWHRFAREVSDYWWYPFDLPGTVTRIANDTINMAGREFRSYRRFNENTPLLDYYWDENENEKNNKTYENSQVEGIKNGVASPNASPQTFSLNANTPIYAMANGELIAARLPLQSEEISSGFVLIKHEVFHDTAHPIGTNPPLSSDTINYDKRPKVVYSLYMHLNPSGNIDFDRPSDNNPDWLNRTLMRYKECELGINFRNANNDTTDFSTNRWTNRPPQLKQLIQPLSTHETWLTEGPALYTFINNLKSGKTALTNNIFPFDQPINIVLGDYLGDSGSIGNLRSGVRVEIFSQSHITFDVKPVNRSTDGWLPINEKNISQWYVSEWQEKDWWRAIIWYLSLRNDLETNEKISNRAIYHYHPFEFINWINEVTWKHEWPKYKVKDVNDNLITRPARPKTRRIPPIT